MTYLLLIKNIANGNEETRTKSNQFLNHHIKRGIVQIPNVHPIPCNIATCEFSSLQKNYDK